MQTKKEVGHLGRVASILNCQSAARKSFRPLWIVRVLRGKTFVHCGLSECSAEKFSSIVNRQSAPRKKNRPLWIVRVLRGKIFVHCELSECSAKKFSSIVD